MGYNGKETDQETGWEDYGFRMYNPSIGRFFTVDPLMYSYPELTPYQYASNRPIDGVDWDGLEWKPIKDANGDYTGFEWAGEEGYDENGKLKDGYFGAAILFKDLGTWKVGDKDNNRYISYNLGSATATVYGPAGPDDVHTYNATTKSSDPDKFATIQEGMYQAVHHQHKDYPALQVRRYDDGNNYKIPTIGKNPAHPDRDYAEGVNIHKAGKHTKNKGYFTGTFWKDGKYHGVSEGCLLIDNGKWDEFIDNFDDVTRIAVLVTRTRRTVEISEELMKGLFNDFAKSDNTKSVLKFDMFKRVERAPGLGGTNKIQGGF